MPITVPQINPTLLQGAAPSGLSNLLPGYLAGTKLAQQRQVAESQARAGEATYQETLRNAANAARKLKRQEAYEAEVAALDVTLPGDRAKLYQIQSQYPDIVTPQSALLPEEPDLPTPVADPEKIKIARFLAPDDVAEQQKIVRSLIEDPESTEKVTNAMVEAATIYPYPEGADDAAKVAIDKQRRDYLLKRTLKEEGDVVIKMPPGPEAGQEALYKYYVEREKQFVADATEAEKTLVQSHQMLRILQESGIRTGAMAGFFNQFKKVAIAMFPGLEDEWGEDIGATDAVIALGNRAALALKKMMPGPLSDKDIKFIMDSAPGLARMEGGNLILLSLMIRGAERSMLYGRLATEYAQQNESGFVDRGFDEWVSKHERWQQYKSVTDGYKAGNYINDILTTIDGSDPEYTQKVDGLPNYTVYYAKNADGSKDILMKMPGTATPAETVTEPPVTTETDLPYFDAITAWEADGKDVLALLEAGLQPITEDMDPRLANQQRLLQRAIDLYKAGKY
jgi:hypothetical protein